MPLVDACRPDPPRSLAAAWTTPTFEIVGRDEFRSYLPMTDFPTLIGGTAVLRGRAADHLRPIIETCGEALPIRLSNHPEIVYLFNVTRVINAVDMQQSQFLELPSGAIGPCEHLVFDPTLIPNQAAFFKTTQMGPANTIFATQLAVDAVKRSGLTGHAFELAWTDESRFTGGRSFAGRCLPYDGRQLRKKTRSPY
jgi:hypothetical protein